MDHMKDLTVSERIRSKFEDLTRAERQLANAILENYPVSGLGSITDVASASGVSSPTVARMAKKLGFSGFPGMQKALRGELEAKISSPIAKHDRWAENAPDTHILNRFADAAMDNLRQSLQHMNPAEFDEAAGVLADENREVFVLGGRITRSLADYFVTHMQVVRDGLVLLPANSNTWPHHVLNMNDGDVLVIFDIRRYEHDILRLAEMASERNVTIILYTDQWGSPIIKHAAYKFHCRVEAPSAWDSSMAILFVVEAVIAAVENLGWEKTKERMNTLETLFDQMKMFRKFT